MKVNFEILINGDLKFSFQKINPEITFTRTRTIFSKQFSDTFKLSLSKTEKYVYAKPRNKERKKVQILKMRITT